MLHIINKSPFQTSSLQSALNLAQAGDAVILIEDGVYAATAGSAVESLVMEAAGKIKFHVLKPDADARGLSDRLLQGMSTVDYGGFVDLVAEHRTSNSWL